MSQLILKHPDFQPENVKFDTVEVHAGEPRDTYGSLIPPIYHRSALYRMPIQPISTRSSVAIGTQATSRDSRFEITPVPMS